MPGWHCRLESQQPAQQGLPGPTQPFWFVRQEPLEAQQPEGQVVALQTGCPMHCPVWALQVWPFWQVPQAPLFPQPSDPHCLPVQFGAQHSPAGLHWLAGAVQQTPEQQPVAPAGQFVPPHWLGALVQT